MKLQRRGVTPRRQARQGVSAGCRRCAIDSVGDLDTGSHVLYFLASLAPWREKFPALAACSDAGVWAPYRPSSRSYAPRLVKYSLSSLRSPDGAQRNPGAGLKIYEEFVVCSGDLDSAALHPGYGVAAPAAQTRTQRWSSDPYANGTALKVARRYRSGP